MKRSLMVALALALLLALAGPASAFAVERSAQNLSVNGQAIVCDKYNIDGYNYFKLRDLALLLNGTDSQFAVGWNAETARVTISTGRSYSPVGNELAVGADKSATAVLSAQTIVIDGAVRRDLSVYNIGGNNYFKLRELGDALGFQVDYDASTNTAVVRSNTDIRLTDLCNITGRLVDDSGSVYPYSYRLPTVTGPDSAYLRQVNAAIREIYEQRVQTALSEMAETGYPLCYCVCYRYALRDGIHSLFITADSDWGMQYYWCFNFDEQGNEVKNAAVLRAAGQTEAGFLSTLRSYLSAATDLSAYVDDESFWKPLQEQTLAPDNLNADIPLALLPNGKLGCVVTVYTPAGAGVYDTALEFTDSGTVVRDDDFGHIIVNRFQGSYLAEGAQLGDEGMNFLLDFYTVGDQLGVEITAFDAESADVYYYYGGDIDPVNAADMLRGDLDSISVRIRSYCPDVSGGSYYGDGVPGLYTIHFSDNALRFDYSDGTPLLGEGDFSARLVFRDDLGLDDPVPETDYDYFDYDAVAALGITGVWSGSYRDTEGVSHGLTLQINSWGGMKLRDVSDGEIPRVLDGSFFLAVEGDEMAPAGDLVYHLVSRSGYKMPARGHCTMTLGADGRLRLVDPEEILTRSGGKAVTLQRVPTNRRTVYAEP